MLRLQGGGGSGVHASCRDVGSHVSDCDAEGGVGIVEEVVNIRLCAANVLRSSDKDMLYGDD